MLGFSPLAKQPLGVASKVGNIDVFVDGVSATGAVGTVVASGGALRLVGVSATAQVSPVTVFTFVPANVVSVSAEVVVGQVLVSANSDYVPDGVSAESTAGQINAIGDGQVLLEDVIAVPEVGQVFISAGANAPVSGVFATGAITITIVWGPIVSDDGEIWNPLDPTNDAVWTDIDPGDTVNPWTPVAA